MKRIASLFCISLMVVSQQAQTLEECQAAAERNYPLIRQMDLIRQTTALTVENIQKGWLPQLSASAQATLQSDVTAFPESMQAIYKAAGISMEGLKKDQYWLGFDVQQVVYDGGAIKYNAALARRQGEVSEAQTEVTLYQVRQRVNEMYFALLLNGEQIALNHDLQELLLANERKLESMQQQGTAAESDYLTVRAERLSATQQLTGLKAQRQMLMRMLSAFCGIEVKEATKPADASVDEVQTSMRPELRAIDVQLRLVDAQEKSLNAALMPRLGLFAQGWYGYPGLNMFEDMMHRQFTLNGIVGARLSWNIGALYTRKNDKAKLNVQRSMFDVQRDVFLFNNNMEQIQQNENIARYRRLMADDEEIISLRVSVRKASESKLQHGIIDINDLVSEIHAENSARLQLSIHEIEMLREIYNLKFTTNN